MSEGTLMMVEALAHVVEALHDKVEKKIDNLDLQLVEVVANAVGELRTEVDALKSADDAGTKGDPGPQGEQGPPGPAGPVGPAPLHRWVDTKLQFQLPTGKWGQAVDLQGPGGFGGGGGGGVRIRDADANPHSTWSSEKIAAEIANATTGGGSGNDKHFQHVQAIASSVWTINHNLGKFPSVVVRDSGGDEVEGDLAYDGPNSLTLSFSAPFGGVAYLN